MNGDIHEWWRAYWESPSSHVGERNAKNDNNEEHRGKVELDACREVIDPEVHKQRMSYWESPSKNVERRNASTACQEVTGISSGISMDPEVSLASVAENAVSSLPSCAMNEVSVVSMSPLPVNRQLDYGGTPPPSGKASGISMLEEVSFDYVANSVDSQPKAVSCATRSTTAQGVSSGGARGRCVLQSKARRGHSRNMQPNARPFSTRKTSAGQLFPMQGGNLSPFLPDQGVAIGQWRHLHVVPWRG